MKQALLVTLLIVAFTRVGSADSLDPPIHGSDFANLGVSVVYWNYQDERALVLPFYSKEVWGDGNIFLTQSFRLEWGQPDYINFSWGEEFHYYPFERFLDFSFGTYLGTFIFLDVTLLFQPKAALDIPISANGFLSMGVAYNYELAIITTDVNKGVGHIDGFEYAISTKYKLN